MRCEDYPCCGHTDGDGCEPRAEHTSEYWSNLHTKLGDERYEMLIEQLDERIGLD